VITPPTSSPPPTTTTTPQGEDQGVVEEFVNPKFKDATRTAFTKATRLECMMQDFPKLLAKEVGGEARIGFTSFEKWLSFSPAKNSLDAGAKGIASGVPPATASSAEMEFYQSHALKLEKALGPNARLEQGETQVVAGIPLQTGPRLVLSPALAVTTQELQEKLGRGAGLQVSGRSTLVLDGPAIHVDSLDLDGTLVIRAGPKARVTVRDAVVRNDGWRLVPVGDEAAEEARIRGFVVGKEAASGAAVVDLRDAEGHFIVTGNGQVLKQ
jgi:UDP-sugar pyrophosphorylase